MGSTTTGSVQVGLSANLARMFDKEPSAARMFAREKGVRYYNHMNNLARTVVANDLTIATKNLDSVASTGIMTTLRHFPIASSKVGRSDFTTAASSTRLKFMLANSTVTAVQSSVHFAASALGYTKVLACFAQVASTRSWIDAALRHPATLVTRILPGSSTVSVRQYGQTTTPGSLIPSTGSGNISILFIGY